MASATLNRTINVCGRGLLKETPAGEALTVGMHVIVQAGELMMRDTGAPTYQIVCEAPERGKGLFKADGSLQTYAENEMTPYYCFAPGDETFVLLATGQNVAQGAMLEAAGNGLFTAQSAGVAAFMAMEAKNNASGSAQLIWAQAV